jgi:hypothetical protein
MVFMTFKNGEEVVNNHTWYTLQKSTNEFFDNFNRAYRFIIIICNNIHSTEADHGEIEVVSSYSNTLFSFYTGTGASGENVRSEDLSRWRPSFLARTSRTCCSTISRLLLCDGSNNIDDNNNNNDGNDIIMYMRWKKVSPPTTIVHVRRRYAYYYTTRYTCDGGGAHNNNNNNNTTTNAAQV